MSRSRQAEQNNAFIERRCLCLCKNNPLALLGFLFLTLNGCTASEYEPVIAMEGVNRARYKLDLKDCRDYAAKVDLSRDAAASAVAGLGAGAALGAAYGMLDSQDVLVESAAGAITGAALGGGSSVYSSKKRMQKIVRKCMRHRGYVVYE